MSETPTHKHYSELVAERDTLRAENKTVGFVNDTLRDQLRRTEAELAEARAKIERMEKAVNAAGEISREYESEYAGRNDVYCTSCNARLTDRDKHHDGCAWPLIDAALAKEQPR